MESPNTIPYSCTDTGNNPWCDVSCVGGSKRVPVRAGPGILSGEPNIWLNATPVEPYSVPNIINIERYAGTPYNQFINPSVQPFSLSFPLMTWGSQTIPEWNLDETFEGYSKLNPSCNNGIGFYELRASARTGRDDWQFSAKTESLPLQNYLLNTEPNDEGNFNTAAPYDFLGGSQGCQMHSEHSYYDFSQLSVEGRPAYWTPASTADLLERHEKPLCNLQMLAVTVHVHKCGGGVCDCVKFNEEVFGGNCGCPLPGCSVVGRPAYCFVPDEPAGCNQGPIVISD